RLHRRRDGDAMMIFRDYAPLYWNAGVPAIPLRQRSKAPARSEWTEFGRRMPSEEEREDLISRYPHGNIGLPFGPASGLCAIDIDTTDEALVAAIEDCLPQTPWRRVGAKGCALV